MVIFHNDFHFFAIFMKVSLEYSSLIEVKSDGMTNHKTFHKVADINKLGIWSLKLGSNYFT